MDKITSMLVEYAPKALGAILTIIIGFWISSLIAKLVGKVLEKRKAEPSLIPFLKSLTAITIKVLVLLSAAAMFGLETTSFVAVLGAVGFAVGMALQGNLSHLASGILILIFKPYREGDFIVAQGYSGTVKRIEIFNTVLTTLDNRIIIIPNGNVTGGPIENLTANDIRKVPMTFGIGYTDDIDKARQVIQKVCDSCPEILKDKPVDILVTELADSSVNFSVRPWTKTEDYWTVYAFMHEAIKKEFDKENIGIPFPQMDVHVHNNA
ncbi:MAG: mechanosensitive ion channel [Flavobacteriales bacterium]|nr:mechanosensitive ion channel [Flavobacteriales bacterium]